MRTPRALSRPFAVALDIDGVLYRGARALPGAAHVVETLTRRAVPFVCLTNGGGVTEDARAALVSRVLGVPVPASRMILSHTPMRALAARHGHDAVLLAGMGDVLSVARAYGFRHAVELGDYSMNAPALFPFGGYAKLPKPPKPRPPNPRIGAVMVLSDPARWEEAIQVIVDVLMSTGVPGDLVHDQSVPLYLSNPDFVYADEFPVPRFAQGAFRACLELLYEQMTARPLQFTQYGKPEAATYAFAESLLADLNAGHPIPPDRIYAIGDNPRADVRGANRAGWVPILTRSGVYADGDPLPPTDTPAVVVDGVADAWEWICEREGL